MTELKNKRLAGHRRRILVLDDHPMTRYGVTQLINDQSDLAVCGEAENANQALDGVQKLRPDLVLADISLPGKNGLDFIKELQLLSPGAAVLVMSMHDENIYAERVLRAGGRGYIMKCEGGAKLLDAIRRVLEGQVFVSQAISESILDGLTRHSQAARDDRPGVLTDREFEIFQMIGQGMSTSQIGRRLNLSPKTVGTHRINMKRKLGVQTGQALVRMAVRWASAQQIV